MAARRSLDAVRAVAYTCGAGSDATLVSAGGLTLRDSERLIGGEVNRSCSAYVTEPVMVKSVLCAWLFFRLEVGLAL